MKKGIREFRTEERNLKINNGKKEDIDNEHQDKFIDVWLRGHYRNGSTAFRMKEGLIEKVPTNAIINDYGCGTGRLEVWWVSQRPKQKINMFDITVECLEDEAINVVEDDNYNVEFYEVDLSNLKNIPKADWGFCINVLMTVQKENLNAIMEGIHKSCDNLIAEMYDLSDKRLGFEMTTVKKNSSEWEAEFKKYWKTVEFIQSGESPHRYIFICKKK